MIDIIKKRGFHEWNTNDSINNGVLLTSRVPRKKVQRKATEYTSCVKCLGPFTKKGLRQHVNKCTDHAFRGENTVHILARAVEGRVHVEANDIVRKIILPAIRDDHIGKLIRFDRLLITWCNELSETYSEDRNHKMIRQKLRLAGRFLFVLQEECPQVIDFESVYKVHLYNSVINAIRKVGKLDVTSKKQYQSPYSAKSLATLLKQIGTHLVSQCIMQYDEKKEKETKKFLELVELNIYRNIRKPVLKAQAQMRREKKHNIPTTNDVKTFYDYLESERETVYDRLTVKFSKRDWIHLSELVVASIVVYNKRRTGEIQYTLTSDFTGREKVKDTDKLLFECLDEESRQLVNDMSRMIIRGKLDSDLDVLLKPEIEKSIELLLSLRSKIEIPDENKYLFALPSKTQNKTVEVCRVVTKLSKECGAKNPSSLRGTNMRKHFASMSISLNLDDSDASDLAKFMGHSQKVHDDYYRHNPLERQVVKMMQLMEHARGNVPNSK